MSKNDLQSEKELKSSGRPTRKSNASANAKSRETTSKPKEVIASEAFDHWVDNLDSATQESFCVFASETFSVIQVYLYARFLGYDGSIVDCDQWVKQTYEKPNHLKVLLREIEEMQIDIHRLREDIENYAVKRDVGVARIAAMQKELRGTISQVENFTSSRDRKGLLMAGADRALREIASIFKDDPIEAPLNEAALSVWARMQYSEE